MDAKDAKDAKIAELLDQLDELRLAPSGIDFGAEDAKRCSFADKATAVFHSWNDETIHVQNMIDILTETHKFLLVRGATNAYLAMTKKDQVWEIDIGHAQLVDGAKYLIERFLFDGIDDFQNMADHFLFNIIVRVIVGTGNRGPAKIKPAVLAKVAEFNAGRERKLSFVDKGAFLDFKFEPRASDNVSAQLPDLPSPGSGWTLRAAHK
jgi:hypothetical protein